MLARSTLLLTAGGSGGGGGGVGGSGLRRHRRPADRPRAYDGFDNASMGYHLGPADPYKTQRAAELTEMQRQQQQQQQQQPFADYHRRSITADSDATSGGGPVGGLASTTPVGSYLSGVLGGPAAAAAAAAAAADEDDEDSDGVAAATAAAAEDEETSAGEAAAHSVVRLRAEAVRTSERLRAAELRARQAERQRDEAAERAAELAEELAEARRMLRERQRQRQRTGQETEHAGGHNPDDSGGGSQHSDDEPTASQSSSLEADLQRASQRLQSLEAGLQDVRRRLVNDGADKASGVSFDADRQQEAVPNETEVGRDHVPLTLAVGAMSQSVADLQADTEALRRKMTRQEERRRQQAAEAEAGEAAGEEALLAVSLGLEAAKEQNQELRSLLGRGEREREVQAQRLATLQKDCGRLRKSEAGWEEWAARVEAGREDLRRLGAANAALRERLGEFDSRLAHLRSELGAAREEAARRSERCRRLETESGRARQSAEAAMAALDQVAAENRSLRRRLVALADAVAKTSEENAAEAAPEVVRRLRELAESVRVEFKVAGLPAVNEETAKSRSGGRQSTAQLAALIEQIDRVEAQSDGLLISAKKRHLRPEKQQKASTKSGLEKPWSQQQQQQQQQPLLPEDRGDVQRLMRMLLYTSSAAS